jgi:hypothetical protein
VFSTVLLSHVTFGFVQFVVATANVAWLLTVQWVAVDVAELCFGTVLKWHGYDTKAAGLLLQLALVLVDVSVGCADGLWLIVVLDTGWTLDVILETGAWSDVRHLNSTSVWDSISAGNVNENIWNSQASRLGQFTLVSVGLGVSSADLVALAEDGVAFLRQLLARSLWWFSASVDFLVALLDRDHVNVLFVASVRENRRQSITRVAIAARVYLPAVQHLQLALRSVNMTVVSTHHLFFFASARSGAIT